MSLVLTTQQQSLFNNCFSGLLTRCLKANENSMAASLARLAINIIRMMSVIAVLRRIEQCGISFNPSADISEENKKDDIIPSREVEITYEDFDACLSMAEPLYLHATHIISFINSIEVKNRNISDRERLLDMMDDKFSRNQWAETANDMGVPLNTADSWLRRLVKSGVVVKGEERGMYIKFSFI